MIATDNSDSLAENNVYPDTCISTKTMCSLQDIDQMSHHEGQSLSNRQAKSQDLGLDSNYKGETGSEVVMDVEEEDNAEGCQGGVVAGSSIPAGVSLGDWPEESVLLGADLLPHWSPAGSVRDPASSKLGLLEIVWDKGQVIVHRRRPPTDSLSTASTAISTCMRSARDRHEQNIELCREGDRLQVLTLRDIRKGERLCVWYGDQLAREAGVPFLTTAHIRGSNEYVCTACGSVFVYPNALKAHMLHQCSECQSSVNPKTGDRPLVPFDRLLNRLHKSSQTSKRKRSEQSPDHKTNNVAPERKVDKRRFSRRDSRSRQSYKDYHSRKEGEIFLKASCISSDKLCSPSPHQADKLPEDISTLRKPATSKDGILSQGPGTWSSLVPSSSLTLSLAPFPSSPPDDDSVKMSPDSSTDQNSALNLSLRISPTALTGSSVPVSEQSPSHLRRQHIHPGIRPSHSSLPHWRGPAPSNNILAQTFPPLSTHAFDTTHPGTANVYLPNILPLAQASFLAEQYFHRYHFHQQYTPLHTLSSVKQHMLPNTNSGIVPFNSFQNYQQYPQSVSFKSVEEMQRHHQSHRCRPQQKHPHFPQQQPQQQQHQQPKIHLNKSPLSPTDCATPLLMRSKRGSPSLPTLTQSQHQRNQQHQAPRTSSSNLYGLTLPSDKEPLDLLPQAYFANKSKKGHLCLYCGKIYSRKYGLKIHMRTHNGYKPLKCKICSRPFGDPSNLNKHVRLHAQGETPYRCDYCGKVLVRRRDLDRHIKSRHPTGERRDTVDNDVETEDWEEEKRDEEADDIIDVASIDEGLSLSETAPSSCNSPIDV